MRNTSRSTGVGGGAPLRSTQVEGYCSAQSARPGQSVRVSASPPTPVLLEVFRMGYYQGCGARLVATLGPFDAATQPTPAREGARGVRLPRASLSCYDSYAVIACRWLSLLRDLHCRNLAVIRVIWLSVSAKTIVSRAARCGAAAGRAGRPCGSETG
jgi:hypothetical protein